jgi:hypothetical protein
MRNWLIGLLVAAAALFAAWYYASPFYAMYALRDAAQSGDESALESSVDFPLLRENLKAELRERIAGENANDLGALGARIGAVIAGPVIDGLVTPEAIATIVRQGDVLPHDGGDPGQAAPASGEAEWTVNHDGLSRFTAQPSTGGTALVFERRGLEWKLVGIDLQDS